MKRFFASASAAALIVTALSGSARANADYVPVIDDHPVRVAAYPLHINETLSEPGNSSAL